MPDEKAKRPGQRVNIQVDEATAQGLYSNLALINHSENEFVIDFAFAPPGSPAAKVRARMILTPRHAKRLLHALGQNVARYEQRFGAITVKVPAEGEPVVN
ncbi:MAG: DUF3467 domain-containing protein [Myxococcota bacterium]